MNRIEFMTELASLLQDIPVEERKDAMQYYNDYFDDALASAVISPPNKKYEELFLLAVLIT